MNKRDEESSTPQHREDAELDYVVNRMLDNLQQAHVAVTASTGYDPERYSSTYSEAAALIRRLRGLVVSSERKRNEIIDECINLLGNEYVDAAATKEPTDEAYNAAVGHCIGALRGMQGEHYPSVAPSAVGRTFTVAATPGAYRWIESASKHLREAWKLAGKSMGDAWHSTVDQLLAGVPTEPAALGFDSPADRYARAWHALNSTPPSYVLVSRSFLEATPCPNASCSDGMIVSTGPDPLFEPCQWCEEKSLILSGAERATPSATGEIIKACRDIHVYGATPEVVGRIVAALSAYDNR